MTVVDPLSNDEHMASESSVEVVAIVLNLNAGPLTAECISSLLRSEQVSLRVIVLDNGSVDDSVMLLRKRFGGDIDIFTLPSNEGVARGWNYAIRESDSLYKPRFFFLLNNDAKVDPSVLSELVGYAKRDSRAGILGPTVVDSDPPFDIQDARHKGLKEPTVDYRIQGSAMLVRAEVFQDVGLFDEDYFAYGEEHDLMERMRRSSWTAVYVPTNGKVYHKGSATSSRMSSFEAYHRTRGGLLLAGKNLSGTALFLHLAAYFCRWLPTWILSDLRSEDVCGRLSARWEGLKSGVKGYLAAKARRRGD